MCGVPCCCKAATWPSTNAHLLLNRVTATTMVNVLAFTFAFDTTSFTMVRALAFTFAFAFQHPWHKREKLDSFKLVGAAFTTMDRPSLRKAIATQVIVGTALALEAQPFDGAFIAAIASNIIMI